MLPATLNRAKSDKVGERRLALAKNFSRGRVDLRRHHGEHSGEVRAKRNGQIRIAETVSDQPSTTSQETKKGCLFCGKPERNSEHILSHAVWAVLGAGQTQLEVGVWDGQSFKDFRPAHGQNTFVTKAVCKACNSGWMSNLEADFVRAAGPLMQPEWPILADEFMKRARSDDRIVAKWAVKTAITSNSSGKVRRRIHSHIANKLRENMLPPGLRVFLGRIKEKGIFIKVNQGFEFVEPDGSRRWRGPAHNTAFDAIFQLNHLAIRAVFGPHLQFTYSTGSEAAPTACFPPNVEQISANYSFPNLAAFEGDLTAKLMENPEASEQ